MAQAGASDKEKYLLLSGGASGNPLDVTAYYTQTDSSGTQEEIPVGKLNIANYDRLPRKLVLVPVNEDAPGITSSGVQQGLNAIYAPGR